MTRRNASRSLKATEWLSCRPRYAFKSQLPSCLLGLMLLCHAAASASSKQPHLLLNDAKVLVTQVELSSGETYTLSEDRGEAVWTSLDPVVLLKMKSGQQSQKRVHAGDAATVNAGEQVEFRAGNGLPARLIVVKPKMAQQDLTVGSFFLTGSFEDASDRNATLFIAISNCHFQDTRNLGDESQWVPSKPDVIAMKVGSVRWIRPGIHHFKNLGSSAVRLVSIEW